MQKVEGSNPFCRSRESPAPAGLSVSAVAKPIGDGRQPNVAHPPTNVRVLWVTRRLPKRACYVIVECNKRRDPSGSLIAKVALGRAGKAQTDAVAAIVLMDSKPIDVPAPAIPASNDPPDDLFVSFGYEQSGWAVQDEALDVLSAIWRAGISAAGRRPKTQYRVDVAAGAAPDCEYRRPVHLSAPRQSGVVQPPSLGIS